MDPNQNPTTNPPANPVSAEPTLGSPPPPTPGVEPTPTIPEPLPTQPVAESSAPIAGTLNPTTPFPPASSTSTLPVDSQPAATPTLNPIQPPTDTSVGLPPDISPQATETPTSAAPPSFNPPAAMTPPDSSSLYSTLGAPPDLSSRPEPTEPAPTDLSQLSGLNGENHNSYTPPVSTPETLVIPQAAPIPESLNAESSPHKFPKPLLIGGILVILLVAAASAYFFFFNKSSTPALSTVPAQVQQPPLTNPPNPITNPQPVSSQSAGFGTLNPSSATTSGTPTSAIDILRQRQAATASGTTR